MLILLAAACVALYLYLSRTHGYWKKRGITYEKPVVIFGNLWDSVVMKRNQGQIATDIYRKYPKERIVGYFNFDYPALIVRDPELAHKVFVTEFHHFADNDAEVDDKADPSMSKNLFFQKGESWKQRRQQLSPAFTIGKIKPVFGEIRNVAQKLKKYIGDRLDQELHIKDVMSLYTSELVACCAFGIDGHSFTATKPLFQEMGKKVFQPSTSRALVMLSAFIVPSIMKLFKIAMVPQEVEEFFNGMLRSIIEHRQRSGEKRNDIMQHWIELKKKSEQVARGEIKSDVVTQGTVPEAMRTYISSHLAVLSLVFTDDDILAGCITVFVEGFETTSIVPSFLLYQLAINPNIQDKVVAEVDQVFAQTKGELNIETMVEMPYLTNCILETLRLHPAIWTANKRCTKAFTVDIGKKEPLIIEEGMSVVIPIMGFNRDPRFWDEPDKFDPDRHTEENKMNRPKGLFMPFGDGPRICIGTRLAYLMMKVGISTLLKDFRVVPSARTPKVFQQDPKHFMSCQKGGMYVKFIKRV